MAFTSSTGPAPATAPAPAEAPTPVIELIIDAHPPTDEKKEGKASAAPSKPKVILQESIASDCSSNDNYRRPRRRPVVYNRRPSWSPVRVRGPGGRERSSELTSSTHLLDKVSKYDGLVDMPFPARQGIYLTTFPFTDKDLKKWSWILSLGVEDTYLEQVGRGRLADADSDDEDSTGFLRVRVVKRGRDRSPIYDPDNMNIPSVSLSRALDTNVVPEDTQNIKFLIVSQNRNRPQGSKLLVAESRKAAGMMMYYELLRGESVMFVGAVVQDYKKSAILTKFKRVETVEEATNVQEDGAIGVIC